MACLWLPLPSSLIHFNRLINNKSIVIQVSTRIVSKSGRKNLTPILNMNLKTGIIRNTQSQSINVLESEIIRSLVPQFWSNCGLHEPNKLASSKVRYFETTTQRLTDLLTGVKCRATSVAKI